MTPRSIHSLMRRRFYSSVTASEGYRHLMIDGVLDEALVNRLIADYISGHDAIAYADARHGAVVSLAGVFQLVKHYRSENPTVRIQIVATDLSARVVIENIGVGAGEDCTPLPKPGAI